MSSRFYSWVAAVLLLGTVAIPAFLSLRNHWPPDLAAVYFGASAYAAGEWQSVYAAPSVFFGALIEDPFWLSVAQQQGEAGAPLVSFVYPPVTAALIAPVVEGMNVRTFLAAGLAIELACLCLAVFLARDLAGGGLSPLSWAFVSLGIGLPTIALQNAIFHAQPQIIIAAMILLAFVLYRRGMDISAGLVLAVAGSIKIAPLFLCIIFLADRRWRAAAAAAAGVAAFALLGVALAGIELQLAFLEQMGRARSSLMLSPMVYSAEGLLTAFWAWMNGSPAEIVAGKSFSRLPTVVWINGLCIAMLIAGSVLILRRTRHAADASIRLLGIWSLLVVFGPLAWAHYAIGPILLLPSLLRPFASWRAIAVVAPVVVGLSLPPPWIESWLVPGVSLGALVAVMALLAVAVLAAVGAVRPRDEAGKS